MTGRASEISEADERSEGSYRACLAIAYNLGTILAHLLFMACCSGNPVSFFQIYYILISGRGVWGEGVAPGRAPIEPGRMTGRAWKLTLVSEGEGSSRMMVLAVASLPNEKYISIRGRGLGRGSSKLFIAHTSSFPPRADDGKGEEAQRS